MASFGGYGNPAGRTEEVAVVEAVYEAFARRDLAAALRHVHPDVVLDLAGTQDRANRTELYRGHAGLREYFADVARVWEELEVHPGHMRVTPGGVVVFGRITAREDGRRVSRRAVWTWRLRDGLVVAVRAGDLGEARPTV